MFKLFLMILTQIAVVTKFVYPIWLNLEGITTLERHVRNAVYIWAGD